ncbi:MAG TPA: carbohydrate ABC transporter permease [Chloroflexota bacterium]|nr:carbohydrate ABC transporter permease [Chloroflexota bacterium]
MSSTVVNLLGVILPGLWSAFGIFLMRQYMETIPRELLDAARIDGASEWRIMGQVVLPLPGAPLAALAIITFLTSWDALLWPSIVLTGEDRQTIPLVLAGLKNLYWTRYDMWMAGAMLTVTPVMALYLVASKQFIRGIAMTGIKADARPNVSAPGWSCRLGPRMPGSPKNWRPAGGADGAPGGLRRRCPRPGTHCRGKHVDRT